MKLKTEIIYRIDGHDRRNNNSIKRAIQKELNVCLASVYRYMNENIDNGCLTKLAALKIISEKLDLSIEYLVE